MSSTPVIVVAPDSFKGSVSAAEAAAAIARGVRAALPDAEVVELPMADGGEGTLDAVLTAWGAEPREVDAVDALGRPRRARFGLSPDGRTAVVEAAEGNGLPHVADAPPQPLRADSTGAGILARAALDAGADELLLCIGGSASSDGGTGLLRALGARFPAADGTEAAPGAQGLSAIRSIGLSGLHPAAARVRWRIAVDVDNPLTGPRGAGAVFGPQKGATASDIAVIDAGLAHLAQVIAEAVGADAAELAARPGMGAAGGIPLGLTALLGAEIVSGSALVAEAVGLREALARADLVITGEGRFDEQSLGGKVVDAVRRAARPGTPVVVLAGEVALDAARCRAEGIAAALSIAPGPRSREELMARTPALLEELAAHTCALVRVG